MGSNKVTDKNRLSVVNVELCKEWDYEINKTLTPNDVACGSNKKVGWKCKNGHKWNAEIYERNRRDPTGCPYCSGKIPSIEHCLKEVNPKLSLEWHPTKNGKLTPRDVTPNSDKSVFWICSKKHMWEAKINNRNNNQTGCPYCSGNKVCIDSCLYTVNPKLSKEWNSKRNGELTPKNVTANSGKKVWWKCKNGHEWVSTIANRNTLGNGCPKCRKVLLKDGSILDSLIEAYLYLKLKGSGFEIQHNIKYGLRNLVCDFYIPKIHTYIEVTSYHKDMTGRNKKIWKKYYDKIMEKKAYVENVLGEKFRFIQYKMNNKQRLKVRENCL